MVVKSVIVLGLLTEEPATATRSFRRSPSGGVAVAESVSEEMVDLQALFVVTALAA